MAPTTAYLGRRAPHREPINSPVHPSNRLTDHRDHHDQPFILDFAPPISGKGTPGALSPPRCQVFLSSPTEGRVRVPTASVMNHAAPDSLQFGGVSGVTPCRTLDLYSIAITSSNTPHCFPLPSFWIPGRTSKAGKVDEKDARERPGKIADIDRHSYRVEGVRVV